MALETEGQKQLEQLTMAEKLDFMSEGTYGCAFKKQESKNKKTKTVVKIQKFNTEAKREDEIGAMIRKIPKYQMYFAPILKSNVVTLGEVNDDEIKKCTIITSEQNIKQKYVTNRIKYVGQNTLGSYIVNVFEQKPKQFMRTFFGSYFDMLYSVNLLNKNGVVHFDLKENNVMYDEDHDRPVLIDFGLSIITKQLTPDKYSEYFFTYGYDYPPWCFEISVITYAIDEYGESFEKELLTAEQVEKLSNNFTNINPIFFNDGATGHHEIFTEAERVAYNKKLKAYLQPFVGGSWKVVVDANLQYINNWDVYAVHVMFLLLLYHVHIYEYNTEEYASVKRFIDKLKREITASPGERKSYDDINAELMKDFTQSTRNQVNVILSNVSAASESEEKTSDIRLKLNKLKLRELKKEKQHYPTS
jgi:serine/threonine protein kinase